MRAASAFFYGGHNPNQDHYYKLRGGVFDESRAQRGRPQTVRRVFTFREFAGDGPARMTLLGARRGTS